MTAERKNLFLTLKPSSIAFMRSSSLFLLTLTLFLIRFPDCADGAASRFVAAGSPSPATIPVLLPESLDAIYQYDDGTAESWLIPGLSGSDGQPEAIFLEHFEVIPGQNVINSIAVAWGSEVGTPPDRLNGQPVTLGIWSDPNNDGQPDDAVLLGWVESVVSEANTDTFITYTFNRPVTISDGGFFLGFKTPAIRHAFAHGRGDSFAGIDTTSSAGEAWMVWNDPNQKVRLRTLGDNTMIIPLDGILPGNFMIRSGF
jgi:hypothetical protein